MSRHKSYLIVLVALVAASLTISGGVPEKAEAAPTSRTVQSPLHMHVRVVKFGSIGDSISALTDRKGAVIPWSWVRDATFSGLTNVGGFKQWGDNTTTIAANTQPIPGADVVVVMAGTNDVLHGVGMTPVPVTLANITAMFNKAGGRSKVLSAIAPKNGTGAAPTLALNAALAKLAGERSWFFIDPWVPFRAADGQWVTGASVDGTHPTPATGLVVGLVMRAYLVRLVR